jgi:hypothetical protein
MDAERDVIDDYDLQERAVYSDDDYVGQWPMFHKNAVTAALAQAEQRGIARVRDEIDRVILEMSEIDESDDVVFAETVGNLVGVEHVKTLRRRLFG